MGKPYRKDGTNAARQEAAHDWDALRLAYITTPRGQRNLKKLAAAHDVNYLSLRSHSSREGWARQARDHDAEIAKEVQRRDVRTQADRMTRFLVSVDLYMDRFHEELAKNNVAIEGNTLVGLIKVAMVHMGEATERVEIHEVRQILVTWTEMALRRLPEPEREPFLVDLRQELGGLLSPN